MTKLEEIRLNLWCTTMTRWRSLHDADLAVKEFDARFNKPEDTDYVQATFDQLLRGVHIGTMQVLSIEAPGAYNEAEWKSVLWSKGEAVSTYHFPGCFTQGQANRYWTDNKLLVLSHMEMMME